MAVKQTEEEFRQHLNTEFNVRLNEEQTLALKLEEVQTFPALTHSRGDMERFSLYFRGPADVPLPQRIYRVEHAAMGEMDIFLVPVARDADGFRYEAVFSYYKEKP
ncbi:MAG TPA: hypothetical protein VE360_04120 [Pyrinomonadaceae bacterium]|nr:hypothetical protein [Pyrinomonadaceae bacterium]